MRPDNTTKIADHYDMTGDSNDYWDANSGYGLDEFVGGRPDSTNGRDVSYIWTGLLDISGVSTPDTDNCTDWTVNTTSILGSSGSVLDTGADRFYDGSYVPCDSLEFGPPDGKIGQGILCASY